MLQTMPLFRIDNPEAAADTARKITEWIIKYFETTRGTHAVLGMSGGKDSTICAKLLVDALGPDRVIGVFMPNWGQKDLSDALDAAKAAGLTRTMMLDIGGAYDAVVKGLAIAGTEIDRGGRAGINLAPRLRMVHLYAVSQSFVDGRVCCTGNLSEAMVGYCTLYGDLAGDFAPLAGLFKEDVCLLGKALGLPDRLVDKVPSDGLSGLTDEDNLGFTYGDIRKFCLGEMDMTSELAGRIAAKMSAARFKMDMVRIPRWMPEVAEPEVPSVVTYTSAE